MYNSERTIKETLDALNTQTKKNFEVIIVNDGSTDNSMEIVKKFKADFPLKIISQQNSGPAVARNSGAKHSKKDVIIFLDSDCIPHEDFVEKITAPLKNKEVCGIEGRYETKNKNFWVARYVGYEMDYRQEPMKKAERIDHVATYACCYRKEVFGKGFLNIFRKANMEDTELSYRLTKENKKLVFQPSAIVKHPHPEKFLGFLKQQYARGYWRALGHIRHPEKLVKDSYMGNSMIVQGGLALLFFLTLLFYLSSVYFFGFIKFLYLPLMLFLLLYISNFNLGVYCARCEKKMLFFAPLIASFRSIAACAGFLKGFFDFNVSSKNQIKNWN